jgi:3-oxoacyl-[acyl-carrier-protein] synthase-3
VKAKTGIGSRHIAAAGEYASDLAVEAARKLLAQQVCRPEDIDFLLLCTQSPDYLLPTTACLVQDRLSLPTTMGALDINLGCSGYVYGLSVARGLIEARQARNVLLITCETYSKHMDPGDFSVRVLFGDGAAATLVQAHETAPPQGEQWIGPFVYGTDGRGMSNFILRRGGTRRPAVPPAPGGGAVARDPDALYMNGPEIFSFALAAVPGSVRALLQSAQLSLENVDLFAFHQANVFMLEHLRKKLKIPSEKFLYAVEDCGNTTSSSIPIVLHRASQQGRLRSGNLVMLVGFGVGYSWAAALVRWFS